MAATPRINAIAASSRAERLRAHVCALALTFAFVAIPAQTQVRESSPTPASPPANALPNALPKPPVELQPGEYLWMPQLAPKGPVVIVVSLPEQLAYVYRNGVRIAISTVSTGKPGYETPTGVFTILQKSREHYSNLYDNAPMPFMQRLTWSGVALHAGKVPDYPASHGCVRLPYAFSEKLFGITNHGMTVVIADDRSHAPTVAFPGLFAPVDPNTGAPRTSTTVPMDAPYRWAPEAAPEGPLTIVMSTRDREVAILRNGIEIGRAAVRFSTDEIPRGTHAYVLLEGSGEGASPVVPDRPALRWLRLPLSAADRRAPLPTTRNSDAPNQNVQGTTAGTDERDTDAHETDIIDAAARGDISVAPEFARSVYDVLTPGTTLVVTDEPLHARDDEAMTVLRADRPPVATPSTDAPPPR